ncbi:MAG: clostripain [Ruminococcaceae bacterium]|mgnify:CR=1 FL=1|nr:clostripain [Oscillospiraceae bacterium]
MHTFKKWLACLTAVLMLAALAACGGGGTSGGGTQPASQATSSSLPDNSEPDEPDDPGDDDTTDATALGALYDPDDTWAVYWYLCGSDLESDGGAASTDLEEMFEVQLPDNVTVVVETGGAATWMLDIDPSTNSRFAYTSAGFELVDQKPSENMGDPDTLADFLAFCNENYPADHTAVLFWNHGGGSVSGAAFDQLFGDDSLTLPEMREAFSAVYELDSDAPPFELIGFDTCLMATIDVAAAFQDIGRYLVASEELEPGCGWYYTGWVGALAENPGLNGGHLGQAICDTYYEACEYYGLADDITLSVTDLSRLPALTEAYDAIGQEALASACNDPAYFFTGFGRAARSAENYGNSSQSCTNMVDLGDLVRKASGLLPESTDAVLSALDDCVVYKVQGPYRSQATGLACYYSYNNDYDDFSSYAQLGTSEAFAYLYDYEITGTLSDAGMEYVGITLYDGDDSFAEELAPVPSPQPGSLEDYPVAINDDGYAVLELGPDNANLLTSVRFQIAYMDLDSGMILFLGGDNDLDMDWENGVFTDNFRGVWGALDGALVYMEITYEDDHYTLYNVPILLNGEEQTMVVSYSYDTGSYNILGVRSGVEENGMANRNLRALAVGDVVEPQLVYTTLDSDDFEQISVGSITVTEDTTFAETDLGDGTFAYMFEMLDIQSNTYLSDLVFISVEDGDITMETMDD